MKLFLIGILIAFRPYVSFSSDDELDYACFRRSGYLVKQYFLKKEKKLKNKKSLKLLLDHVGQIKKSIISNFTPDEERLIANFPSFDSFGAYPQKYRMILDRAVSNAYDTAQISKMINCSNNISEEKIMLNHEKLIEADQSCESAGLGAFNKRKSMKGVIAHHPHERNLIRSLGMYEIEAYYKGKRISFAMWPQEFKKNHKDTYLGESPLRTFVKSFYKKLGHRFALRTVKKEFGANNECVKRLSDYNQELEQY